MKKIDEAMTCSRTHAPLRFRGGIYVFRKPHLFKYLMSVFNDSCDLANICMFPAICLYTLELILLERC
uniref:Uncharacterized protein n=1 Tax=Pararge aegeria TaxID=116150 RepID=S4NXZ3_9NEOP